MYKTADIYLRNLLIQAAEVDTFCGVCVVALAGDFDPPVRAVILDGKIICSFTIAYI